MLCEGGEWITNRVLSLVCAAEGDQFHEPVITFRLSITANLSWTSLRCASKPGFSWILTPLKLFVEPEGLAREQRATAIYELEDDLSFCLGEALAMSQTRSWILRKAPALLNNNGALQLRVRLEEKHNFINRLGRFDDSVARAKVL